MSEQDFRIVCMDCPHVMQEGPVGAPVSHGLCDTCFQKRMHDVRVLKRGEVAQ